MSNLTADVRLLDHSHRANLEIVKEFLYDGKYMYYIHESHLCSRANDRFWRQPHVKVVVYASLFYEEILAMVLGYNAGLLEQDIDIDSHPVTIGWCICNVQTQMHTYAMNGVP